MKILKKTILIIILPIFIIILFIYRNQNIAKREALESNTWTTTTTCDPADYNPVCGEDKITYANECTARKNATLVSYSGACRIEDTASNTPAANTGTLSVWKIKTDDEYYNTLEAQCGDDSCCVGSVHTMRVGGYKLANDGECGVGEHINSADCSGSLQWCELGAGTNVPSSTESTVVTNQETTTAQTGTPIANLNNIAPEWKRTLYYNPGNNYSFSVPKGDYFAGFGAQDGASHTVGITAGTGVTSFDTAQVKLYYYKTTLPELANAKDNITQEGNKTYVKLENGSVMIDGDPTSKTVSTIIATIKSGSGASVANPSL